MSRLDKRVEDLERKAPETDKAPKVERVIIGKNEAGEWVEKRIITNGVEE
ncbi:hypothetical protein [Roseivivax sediminis]|uniref:Uncharacterized protein n=1 Tax=Roseivivax sediminis TaxID=936889 RepID=A0A1I1UHN1_9RHOB|nr:hypothetical protein [Roseivivax sediminis]SFD67440.1 hypothetical protein SAMN04515678_102226 [Roseivivax sediminis]